MTDTERTKSVVTLREMTNKTHSVKACKEALESCDWDVDKARDYLNSSNVSSTPMWSDWVFDQTLYVEFPDQLNFRYTLSW